MLFICFFFFFFFFNDTATTEIYSLSLHDALPISCLSRPSYRGICEYFIIYLRTDLLSHLLKWSQRDSTIPGVSMVRQHRIWTQCANMEIRVGSFEGFWPKTEVDQL